MTASDEYLDGASRRHFLKGVAAVTLGVGGAAAGGLLGALPAQALSQAGLPPIGAEIPCRAIAANARLRIRNRRLEPDFRGGIRFRVEKSPQDPQRSVRLKVTDYRMTAELPVGRDTRQGGGSINIEQNDIDADPRSLLRQTQASPPRYDSTLVLSFTMTIDEPGNRSEPLVLITKNPAVLSSGQLSAFPPRGDLYRLQEPVDLVLPDQPDTVVGTLDRFPIRLGEA